MWGELVQTFFIILGVFFLLELVLRYTVKNQIQDEELEIAQALEDTVVLCRVEQVDDVFYLYDSQSEQFIGQGHTVEDFWNISEQMQKFLMVVDGDKQAIDLLKDMQHARAPQES